MEEQFSSADIIELKFNKDTYGINRYRERDTRSPGMLFFLSRLLVRAWPVSLLKI